MKHILTLFTFGLFFSCAVKDLKTTRHSLKNGRILETKKFDKGSHYYIVATIYDSLQKQCGQCIAVDRMRSGCIVDYKKITIKELKGDTITKTSMDKDGETIQKIFVSKKLIETKKLKHHEAITIMVLRFEP